VISAKFEPQYYMRRYPDLTREGIDPVRHYIEHGAAEGRDPSPDFSTNYYYERYSDVSRDVNAFYHYIKIGRAEGRSSKSGPRRQDRKSDEYIKGKVDPRYY